MPLPRPEKGERENHFISRCISFERNASPDRPIDQVQAMCYTMWRSAKGIKQERENEMNPKAIDLLNMTIIDLKSSKIDKENNVIRHVSILSTDAFDTSGNIFRRFSDKAMNDAVEIFEGSLARIDHDRDNQSTTEPRGVRTGYGIYQDIKREGDKIFGDLHLWDCENARKVLSIAERTPEAVGNSIHAGAMIREDDDGIEIVEQLMPRTKFGFKPSIDLVEDPAATINLFQSKRKPNSKENSMEFKDLTLETVRTNRPDLEKLFFDEGAASRDEEVKKVEQERDTATKELDELKVRQAKSEREILVDKMTSESELPDYAKTDVFRKQLIDVTESKDGDKTISVEDGIKALIQDRINALEPNGVQGNDEKEIQQKKKKETNDDEFVGAFGKEDADDIL